MNYNNINMYKNNNSLYGYNNNNFDRGVYGSQKYIENGGFNGNPMNNFNSMSTMEQERNNIVNNRFNDVYQTPNSIIERINYKNQNNLIHNNVGDTVLDEHVVEYRINIDSVDRDYSTYNNPFNFKVKFKPSSSSILRTETLKNGVLTNINEKIQGSPKPHINREFKNVKYIKLDNIILPQYSNLIFDDPDYIFDPDSYLIDDRYVSLVIPELEYNKIFCTSDDSQRYDPVEGFINPPKPFAHIFPEKLLGNVYYTGTPYYGSKIFNNSALGNINALTIQLYNSNGSILKYDNLLSFKEIEDSQNTPNPIEISDLRHPLNKKIQVHLSFIIGVVETQINTNTKYEQ